MTVIARIKKDGSLLLNNEINERLPVVSDGLVSYYPLDSQAGAVDTVKGNGTNQNLESRVNILEALSVSWRNTNNWNAGMVWDDSEQALKAINAISIYATNFIAVNTSKSYYLEADVKMSGGNTGILYYGFRFYDQNFTEIGVGQHHGTYDYTGCSGLAPSTSWIHVNNTGIGGAPKTGEGDTGGAVFHTGTKYVKLLFLFNYSGAGITWVKNLKLSTSNTNTSNAVITNDGIAIQEATTNMIESISPDFSSWAGFTGSSNFFIAPNGSNGVVLNGLTSGGVMWRQASMPSQVVSPSTTYTVSAKMKFIYDNVHTNFFYIRQYNSSWSQVSEYGIYDSSKRVKMDNGYYHTWASFTTTSDCTYLVIHAYEYNSPNTIWCYDLQLEQRGFTTSYVNGSKGESTLHIPLTNVINNNNGSISFNYLNHYGISSTIISGSIIQNSPPNGAWWGIYRDAIGRVYNHWMNGSSSNTDWVQPINTWANYTLSWDTSNEYFYINGVLQYSVGRSAYLPTNQFPVVSLGFGWNRGDGVFKNFSVYNKTLSLTEIKALTGEGFKITSSKTITPLIIENPNIPTNSYYFPLTSDSKDSGRVINASENTNLVYDGGAWVGTTNANISTYSDNFTNMWNYSAGNIISTNNVSPVPPYNNASLNNFTNASSSWDMYRNYSVTSGIQYTFSMYVKLGTATNFCIVVNNSQAWNTVTRYNFTSADGLNTRTFKRVSITFTAPTTNSVNIHLGGHYETLTQQTVGTVYIAGHQLEEKEFLTPFIVAFASQGNRGTSSLEYNLNSSIGLDWSGNWSICYWKKPIATYSNNMNGYNIESLGCNSNSVGGSYNWWGKDNGGNSISGTDIGGFAPSDYFNLWQFITIIKSGSSCVVKTQLNNGVIYTRSIGVPVSANGYVTQYGYDLKLGGWDNGNPTNTYFRDLIVVKYALSDAEVQNIYKQFSIYKTKVNTQNLIEEGI